MDRSNISIKWLRSNQFMGYLKEDSYGVEFGRDCDRAKYLAELHAQTACLYIALYGKPRATRAYYSLANVNYHFKMSNLIDNS